MKCNSKRFKSGDIAYTAKRDGDAVRIDMWLGQSKVKNFCYYFDVTNYPDEIFLQWNFVWKLLQTPTLLKGSSIVVEQPNPPNVDAVVKAISQILE